APPSAGLPALCSIGPGYLLTSRIIEGRVESSLISRDLEGGVWDPGQYLRYAGERARPFFDLLARVGADDPGYVADLGRGRGNLTAVLADRWPAAEVVGVDNSPEMIDAARAAARNRDRLSFTLADIRDWRPDRKADVLLSNAVLQWVPGHLDLVRQWPGLLAPGGWLAFQLPGNFDQPTPPTLLPLTPSPPRPPPPARTPLH